jgi:putative phosphoesterase
LVRVKLVILSDIHANLIAFDALIAAVQSESPDLVVHGGDLILNGPRPAEVVDRVRDLGWPGVVGNTDEVLWGGMAKVPEPVRPQFRAMANATAELLGEERVEWLRQLPWEWRYEELLLVHASPGDLWNVPMPDASDEELKDMYSGHSASTVVYCHIHVPFVRQVDDLTVANSGSVGWPMDGDWRASYLVVEDGQITVRRVEYDLEREIAELRSSRYPTRNWLEQVHRQAKFVQPFTLDP